MVGRASEFFSQIFLGGAEFSRFGRGGFEFLGLRSEFSRHPNEVIEYRRWFPGTCTTVHVDKSEKVRTYIENSFCLKW